jgi:hypothetical protein
MIYPLPRTTEVEQFRGPLRTDPRLRKGRKLKRSWKLTPPLMERNTLYNKTHTRNTNSNFNTHTVHTLNIKFLQINLHHSKAAMATLCQQLAEKKVDIYLFRNLGYTRAK